MGFENIDKEEMKKRQKRIKTKRVTVKNVEVWIKRTSGEHEGLEGWRGGQNNSDSM